MKVKNLGGTGEHGCPCGTWLKHWENFSAQAPSAFCSVVGCIQAATLGAHVIRTGETLVGLLGLQYIVPMCASHNSQAGAIDIDDRVQLVSADVAGTCGKPRRQEH